MPIRKPEDPSTRRNGSSWRHSTARSCPSLHNCRRLLGAPPQLFGQKRLVEDLFEGIWARGRQVFDQHAGLDRSRLASTGVGLAKAGWHRPSQAGRFVENFRDLFSLLEDRALPTYGALGRLELPFQEMA